MRSIEDIQVTLDTAMDHLHADASEAQRLASEARSAVDVLLASTDGPRSALQEAGLRAEVILAICMSISGQIYHSIQTGLSLLERASEADAGLRARLLNMLGVNYDILEQHDEALEQYTRCLALQRSHGDSEAVSRVLGNIGVVYSRIGDEPRALKHLKEAIEIGQRSGAAPGRLARHTLNAAISLRRLGRQEEAATALADAERYAGEAGHSHTLAYVRVNRSDFHVEAGRFDDALTDIEAAMDSADRLPGLRGTLFHKKASILRRTDRIAAIATALSGLEEAGNHDATETLAQLHELLSELYEEGDDFKTALHHHRLLHATRSALILRAQDARIANLQAVHELERTRRERDWLMREREVLSETNVRLVDLDRERKELLSIAAHDIRSPITLVSVLADLMSIGGMPPEEVIQTGIHLKGACKRTVAIIDKLLSVRALETGERDLKLQRLDPVPVLNAVLELLRPIANRKSIRIHTRTEENLTILADPISLEQVLDNLISNAIKFSPAGGLIHVEVEALVGGVSFIVRDSGPGLTEADHKRLFQKYARLSARPTADEPSTGLGLYITRQLIELMSGDIYARNVDRNVDRSAGRDTRRDVGLGGAVFQVTLPTPSRI
ncbi:MAG: signal transduction histidine kinase [Myxococcota bacterium]